MPAIGKTTFDDSVTKFSFKRFKKMYDSSKDLRHDLNRNGYTLAEAFKFLTGKDVPKVHHKGKKDKA